MPVSSAVIEQEWEALERLAGAANVDGRPTTAGKRNVPDGGYEFVVTLRDAQGSSIEVVLHLPPGYSSGAVPTRKVRRNGVLEDYPDVEPVEWRRNPRLASLVEEVRRTYS